MKDAMLMNEPFFDFVLVEKIKTTSSIEVLDKLSTTLFINGAVVSQFRNAVIERENNFPTGMPTKIPTALPHTDSEYCLKKALAVAILEEPVPFGLMGGEDGDVIKAKLVFMLSLPDPKSQIQIIQKILDMFRNEQIIAKMVELSERNINDVKNMLLKHFSETEKQTEIDE